MFHKAIDLVFKEKTVLEVKFETGEVKSYDVSVLFMRFPQLKALSDRKLFTSGKLMNYGIIWNEELDLDIETVYENGILIKTEDISASSLAGNAVQEARSKTDLTQKQLAERTGIDQSDISKIERGVYNPSVQTLNRIAKALGCKLVIRIEKD